MALYSIDQTAIIDFDEWVAMGYEGASMLNGTCRTKRGVVGDSTRPATLGPVLAQPHQTLDKIEPSRPAWARTNIPLTEYVNPVVTDVFSDARTNVDERRDLAMKMTWSNGRQEDQIILDALAEGNFVATVQIGSSANTQFNPLWRPTTKAEIAGNEVPSVLVGACKTELLKSGVRGERIHMAAPATWWGAFNADPQITSRDYGPGEIIPRGNTGTMTVHGVMIHFIEDRTENTLNTATGQPGGFDPDAGIGYMWAEDALTNAYGSVYGQWIDRVPDRLGYMITMFWKQGCGKNYSDGKGVVKIENGPT